MGRAMSNNEKGGDQFLMKEKVLSFPQFKTDQLAKWRIQKGQTCVCPFYVCLH